MTSPLTFWTPLAAGSPYARTDASGTQSYFTDGPEAVRATTMRFC